MSKSRMMEFAESLQTMQNQRKEILTKIKEKNLAMSEKNRTFADEEPTALATDVGKPIPILSGESARIFLERARQVEEEAEKRRNQPQSLDVLREKLAMNKFFLEQDIDNVKARYDKICKLEDKIKELEQQNGKTEER